MRTIAAALTCCLLLVAIAGATAVAGAPSTPAPVASSAPSDLGSAQSNLASVQSSDNGNITSPETIEIRIQSDGDARVVLSKEFPTGTENQSAAFERLATEYENGEHGRLGYGSYVSVVDDVAAESGRDMELVENGPRTSHSEDVGTLEYRFTWTNFANVNEANVTVGDAFQTGEGSWLGSLVDEQQLRIRAPEEYSVTESPAGPQIDDDTLVWTGPTTFGEGDLQATFEESEGGSTVGSTVALLLVVLIVVGTVLVFGYKTVSDRSDSDPLRTVTDRVDEYREALTGAENRSADADSPPSDGAGLGDEPSGATGGTTAVDDAEPTPAAAVADQEPSNGAVDPELLSDEERVQHLLEENGGRMKQANIVTETGWSNAKVSQLLSRMDEEEQIDKLRIGRENLITLPDVDVTDQE